MDLGIRTQSFGQGNMSWLGSAHGTQATRSVTLDKSAFTANTHYPDGYVRSGQALGRITATGLYGPQTDGATDGTQNLAGFLFGDVHVPADADRDPSGALLEHGAVRLPRLPVPVSSTARATNPRFIYREN